MLQMCSIVWRCGNSNWTKLKVIRVYKSGHRKQGRVSFLLTGAIRQRRYINPNLRRRKRAKRAFICILTTKLLSWWVDGQLMRTTHNRGAIFTRRIRRSRLKLKRPVFFKGGRLKFLKLSKYLL